MSSAIHRTTYEYFPTVNTPDYPTGTWLINPDLSGVSGVAQKYWKVVGDTVVEMTQGEKDVVDAAQAALDQAALEQAIAENIIVQKAAAASTDLFDFVEANPIWTDSITEIKGPPDMMQALVNAREIFGLPANPLCPSGYAGNLLMRMLNLETILGKLGWYNQQVVKSLYTAPRSLLIYYGYLNSFNSGSNGWNNEKVAQDLCKYDLIVFGDGVQDPGHADYANTQVIIPRVRALKPEALIFGYVSTNQSLATFQTKVGQWDDLGVHGIFMDESGYDFGSVATNGREAVNTKVDYVHGQTSANRVFVNAWNMDHVIGTINDTSYPNTTWNADLLEATLTENDWYLLESFPIHDGAYTASTPDGYEPKADWATRGVKAIGHRAIYGINLAAVGVIANSNPVGQDLFDFLWVSSLMWSLEAAGSSDTYYGSGATVTFWSRESAAMLPYLWSISPSVQMDVGDADIFLRFVEGGHLKLDFSNGAQESEIFVNGL